MLKEVIAALDELFEKYVLKHTILNDNSTSSDSNDDAKKTHDDIEKEVMDY